jgi:hypothetical protein
VQSSRWRTDTLLGQKSETGRKPKLGIVMIKCPQTGRAIPTGMKADREKFRCSGVLRAHLLLNLPSQAWLCEPSEIAETMY